MAAPFSESAYAAKRLRKAFVVVAFFTAFLWLVELVALVFGLELVKFGVYPRHTSGAWGIVWAPLIHGSIGHLFANTGPLLVLGTALAAV